MSLNILFSCKVLFTLPADTTRGHITVAAPESNDAAVMVERTATDGSDEEARTE